VTIRDVVRSFAEVVGRLGVQELACVVGGSMGGMQALEWNLEVQRPKARSIATFCSSGRHMPWQIGISECQRQAITSDRKWDNGDYSPDDIPARGLAVARMMAMLTYRTHPAYLTKFGRIQVSTHHRKIFDVENYLREQGDKFIKRQFDPASYVSLTNTMDTHDIERGRGAFSHVLRSIQVPVLIVSISSDVLYPVANQEEIAAHLPQAQHHIVQSNEGHDGFLLEHEKIGMLLRGFLADLDSPASRL